MARQTAPLVSIDGLTRVFDVSKPWLNRVIEREGRKLLVAAEQVSIGIGRGRTFALVGESGSGKSTIARMVVGLLPPSAGRVVIDGVPLWGGDRAASGHDLVALKRRIQMIFQDPYSSLNPRWRVGDIIAEPIRAFGLRADERATKARVAELLGQVGLAPAHLDRPGAGLGPGVHRLRRADLGPGRVGPGGRAEPAVGPAVGKPGVLRLHQP